MHIYLDDEHIQTAIEALYWSINSELDNFPLNKDNILVDDINKTFLLKDIESLQLKLDTLKLLLSGTFELPKKELKEQIKHHKDALEKEAGEIEAAGGIRNLVLTASEAQLCVEALLYSIEPTSTVEKSYHARIAENIINQFTDSHNSYDESGLREAADFINREGGQCRVDLRSEDVFILILSLLYINYLILAEAIIAQCKTRTKR